MTTLKSLNNSDVAHTRTLLHEAIPVTGTIISGTYKDENIKNYAHGMFQSVYDYPYLSSSANHIFDITTGISTTSPLYSDMTLVKAQQSKKKNIYNQMAQILAGYDATGSILQFDEDGDIAAGGNKMDSVFVVPFARLLSKDEIKKESFSMDLGVGVSYNSPFDKIISIADVSASTEYRVNSPAGEYGILYATQSAGTGLPFLNQSTTSTASIGGTEYWYAGLLYYQAGIMILTSSIFDNLLDTSAAHVEFATGSHGYLDKVTSYLTSSQISGAANGLRHRIQNLQFNNTTELNSTVYFCRINHGEFNYSSNPTYTQNSKIRVKESYSDDPVSYITTVGLYNDNNELLATAKLSEPLKKTPSTEFTLRVRLDY